jgi:hypothetical protein
MSGFWLVNVVALLVGAVIFMGLIFRCCYSFVRENKYTSEKVLRLPGGIRNLVQVLERSRVSHGTFGYITVYRGLYFPPVLRKPMIIRNAFLLMDKVPAGCTKVACAPLPLFYPALVKATCR